VIPWRWFAVIVILTVWIFAMFYQAFIGDAPLVPIFTSLLILALASACITEGIARARRTGWHPEPGDEDPNHSWFGEDAIRKVGDWYVRGKISLEQMEVLIGHVLADPERNGVWASHVKMVAQAADLLYRQEVKEVVPDQPVLALPPGYFDGNISADEPEDLTGWAEVRRGMGSSYWVRTR
jgi:hypothetical protein